MATVTAFLKHNFVGKKSQAQPYTTAAHAKYIMRKGAASYIYSENMPKQYHAVQRFLAAHEDGLRANGRVADKFIVSIPHDVSQEDAAKALRRFGFRLGKGRTPFMFAIHGFDTRNHHAHVLFLDRDTETGKRVFGTTLRNSTSAIKLEWETAANDTFAELGYEVRVKVRDGEELELANDNAPLRPDTEIEADAEERTEMEDTTSSEDSMATIERAHDDSISLAANYVRLLADTKREMHFFMGKRAKVEEADARYEILVRQRNRAKLEAAVYETQSKPMIDSAKFAEDAAKSQRRPNGRLKGFGIKLFGYEFKTPGRRAAEAAVDRAADLRFAADHIEQEQADKDSFAFRKTQEAAEAEQEALMRRNELITIYGNAHDLDLAQKTFENTIDKIRREVPVQEAWMAYQNGEVTQDEIREFLIETGSRELLADLEEQQEEQIKPSDG